MISSSKIFCMSEKLLRLWAECDIFAAQKQKIKVKKEYLYKQILLLKKWQSELICTQLHNIKELKLKKAELLLNFISLSETLNFDFNLTASSVKKFSNKIHAASENNKWDFLLILMCFHCCHILLILRSTVTCLFWLIALVLLWLWTLHFNFLD